MNHLQHPKVAVYRPDEMVARGERATVWSGRCPHRMAPVAIKLIHAAHRTAHHERRRERFLNWCAVVQRHDFPLLPLVFDADVLPDGTGLLVSEWVDGLGFEDWRLAPVQIASNIADLLTGLDRMTVHSVAHLNICPQNLLVGLDGSLRLLGLGTPLLNERVESPYSAPELETALAAGGALWRADLYSVALLTCEVLGLTVEGAGTQLPYVQIADDARSLRGLEGLRLLLESALHQLPTRRPASIGVVTRALRNSIERTTGEVARRPKGSNDSGRVMVFGPSGYRPGSQESSLLDVSDATARPEGEGEAEGFSSAGESGGATRDVRSSESRKHSVDAPSDASLDEAEQSSAKVGAASSTPSPRERGAAESEELSRSAMAELASEASNRLEELLFPQPRSQTTPDSSDAAQSSTADASTSEPASAAEALHSQATGPAGQELSSGSHESARGRQEDRQGLSQDESQEDSGGIYIPFEVAVASFDVAPETASSTSEERLEEPAPVPPETVERPETPEIELDVSELEVFEHDRQELLPAPETMTELPGASSADHLLEDRKSAESEAADPEPREVEQTAAEDFISQPAAATEPAAMESASTTAPIESEVSPTSATDFVAEDAPQIDVDRGASAEIANQGAGPAVVSPPPDENEIHPDEVIANTSDDFVRLVADREGDGIATPASELPERLPEEPVAAAESGAALEESAEESLAHESAGELPRAGELLGVGEDAAALLEQTSSTAAEPESERPEPSGESSAEFGAAFQQDDLDLEPPAEVVPQTSSPLEAADPVVAGPDEQMVSLDETEGEGEGEGESHAGEAQLEAIVEPTSQVAQTVEQQSQPLDASGSPDDGETAELERQEEPASIRDPAFAADELSIELPWSRDLLGVEGAAESATQPAAGVEESTRAGAVEESDSEKLEETQTDSQVDDEEAAEAEGDTDPSPSRAGIEILAEESSTIMAASAAGEVVEPERGDLILTSLPPTPEADSSGGRAAADAEDVDQSQERRPTEDEGDLATAERLEDPLQGESPAEPPPARLREDLAELDAFLSEQERLEGEPPTESISVAAASAEQQHEEEPAAAHPALTETAREVRRDEKLLPPPHSGSVGEEPVEQTVVSSRLVPRDSPGHSPGGSPVDSRSRGELPAEPAPLPPTQPLTTESRAKAVDSVESPGTPARSRAAWWLAAGLLIVLSGAFWWWWSQNSPPSAGVVSAADSAASEPSPSAPAPEDPPAAAPIEESTAEPLETDSSTISSAGEALLQESANAASAREAASSVPVTDPTSWHLTEDAPAEEADRETPAIRTAPVSAGEEESTVEPSTRVEPQAPGREEVAPVEPPRRPNPSPLRDELEVARGVLESGSLDDIRAAARRLSDLDVSGADSSQQRALQTLQQIAEIAASWGPDSRGPLDPPLAERLREARLVADEIPSLAGRLSVWPRLGALARSDFEQALASEDPSTARATIRALEGIEPLAEFTDSFRQRLDETLAARARQRLEQRLLTALARNVPHEALDQIDALPPAQLQGLEELVERLRSRLAQLDQRAPDLTIDQVSDVEFQRGEDLTLRLRAEDDYEVTEVRLFARGPSGRDFEEVEVRFLGGRVFAASIPRSLHQDRAIQIYGVATDRSGNRGELGSARSPVRVKPR